jgi:hypothetical protein
LILVFEPGSRRPDSFYFIDAQLTQSTCATAMLSPCSAEDVATQSSAVMFHAEFDDEPPLYMHWPIYWHIGEPRRVMALYGDRTEEVIYVRPSKPASASWMQLALFAVALALSRRALQRSTTTV